VAHDGGRPVHQDRDLDAGSPPVLGRPARGAPGRAGADRDEAGAGRLRPLRPGYQLGGPGHDQLRHLHRDTGNGKAPIAQRGKAKQKRADLRLVGLGLVVTRDGGIPLLSHAYPGNKPDVTQFAGMITTLAARHTALAAAAASGADTEDAPEDTSTPSA